MRKILTLLFSLFFLCSPSVFAEKIDCSAQLSTEYNIGVSSALYVGVNISAKNTTNDPIDGITWIMHSNEGKVLFNETWVGSNQRMHYNINPKGIGIVPIEPGDTTALVPVALFNHVEFLIRDQQGSDGTQMKKFFDESLEDANEKYSDVSCEVVGFVKKMKF